MPIFKSGVIFAPGDGPGGPPGPGFPQAPPPPPPGSGSSSGIIGTDDAFITRTITQAVGEAFNEFDPSGSYSTTHWEDYEYLASALTDAYGITKTSANQLVNEVAGQWRTSFGAFPATPFDLLAWGPFQTAAMRRYQNLDLLPTAFQTEDAYYYNTGAQLVPIPAGAGSTGDPFEDAFLSKVQFDGGVLPGNVRSPQQFQAPFVPNEFVRQLISANAARGSGGGGGGGGGAAFSLDRDAVIENIRNVWRPLMLEEPGNVGQLADAFIREVKAFRRKGGQLELQTWVKGKIRETPRFSMLYSKLPESLAEEEYIGGFTQVARGFGFRDDVATGFIEAGAEAGAGLEGFATQVSRSREASLTSRFAQRMAQASASLGALAAS